MTRRAVVVGVGRSGAACARVLAGEGWDVLAVDHGDGDAQREIAALLPSTVTVRLGRYDDTVADGADLVCPSPGVRWDDPLLVRARSAGIAVRSEIDLAFQRCLAPVVGVTGTNGKTTTTALIGDLLRSGGHTVHVGGNIGETILDRLPHVRKDDWVVLELSSFQIESVENPRCRIAVVLNLSPDHLDRHGTMQAYAAAKRRLVEAVDPDGAVVLNAHDQLVSAMASATPAEVHRFGLERASDPIPAPGATTAGKDVVLRTPSGDVPVLPVADIPLFGAHNVANVLAGVAAANVAGVSPTAIAGGIRAFRPVAHRLEPVAEIDGVLWINDSKATNVDAAVTALQSMDRPVVWIGGGGSKGVGPDQLAAAVARHARHAILQGATGPELDAALAAIGFQARTLVPDLAAAVASAAQVARAGDAVLLAPGYTSWDQHRSFEERGSTFALLARQRGAIVGGAG